jgi:3',5'-nucleoside bisphosphate phosphatase
MELSLRNGGVSVLAHPGGSLQLPDDAGILESLRLSGLCGVEVYSSYHTRLHERFLADYCAKHELVMTAGSDFHGATVKPNNRLGDIHNNSYDLVERLQQRREVLLA